MNHPRIAVVTGAGSGIGARIAQELHAHGWQVAGIDRQPVIGDHLALSLVADVSDAEKVRQAVGLVHRELGPIEGLVTAAGHYAITPVEAITPDEWQRMLRVHLGGLFNAARAAVPSMIERGGGSIVAISSELAIGGGDGEAHYAAAKGAIIGLVRSLAAELAPQNIRVNSVAPGPTDTPLLAPDSPWRDPAYLATLPTRRLARPEEIAATARYLLQEATFCTGEVISPNSGAVI
ncbi:SDR family NAD(P)-dependent oxidoreductase [Streptomyces sp. NPDC059477]|uniref:SDR family NAD(P)-dependent oxidoreductase n=1 Tax=Streptomyces sp. NPDC059477 TaxID=3346847 RepID=UPI0036C376F9